MSDTNRDIPPFVIPLSLTEEQPTDKIYPTSVFNRNFFLVNWTLNLVSLSRHISPSSETRLAYVHVSGLLSKGVTSRGPLPPSPFPPFTPKPYIRTP